MQNKGTIWTFTVLLALASVYQLSFSYFTSSFEKKAEKWAVKKTDSIVNLNPGLVGDEKVKTQNFWREKFLLDNANQEVFPVIGFTYQECKAKQINLGLDLQGGMSVTLEVSIPDLVDAYSGHSSNEVYQKAFKAAVDNQANENKDFVTLFEEAWEKNADGKDMISVFHRYETKEKFPAELTNKQVVEVLRKESKAALDGTEQVLNARINKYGVSQPSIQKQLVSNRIQLELPGVKDKGRIRKLLQSTANLEFWAGADLVPAMNALNRLDEVVSKKNFPGYRDSVIKVLEAKNNNEIEEEVAENVLDDTASVIEDDALILEDDLVESSVVENDAQPDYKKVSPLFSNFQMVQFQGQPYGAVVGYSRVSDTVFVNEILNSAAAKTIIPRDVKFLWASKPVVDPKTKLPTETIQLFAISKKSNKALLDGKVIDDASQSFDQLSSSPQISMSMTNKGAQKWKEITTEYLNKTIAIVLDGSVLTAPTVTSTIPNGQSVITGNYTLAEASDLANILRAGALPAPARIIDEAFVGPTLGAENIRSGLVSMIVALVLVLVYMVFYYSKSGLAADAALVANMVFLLGALAALQASLTLPGIAGIVLTIGMSVDANVLIFERIKEELRSGKSIFASVTDGYKGAKWSILDANITTLLTGIVLFMFGSGPIKGFATTLMIGILTSLFSAWFVSRLVLTNWLEKKKDISFSTPMTKNFLQNVSFDFIGKRKIFYVLSGAILVLGAISLSTKGLNYGVEFTGGTKFKVKFDQPVNVSDVKSTLSTVFVGEDGKALLPEVKTVETDRQIYVTTSYLVDSKDRGADDKIEATLKEGLTKIYPNGGFYVIEQRSVDPTISSDLKQSSLWAITISICVIFLYILIRFKKWQFSAGAVVAIFHDVLIVLSIFSLLGGFLPFSVDIDQAFIAAILTVVGYSINDTVVVFDRIREYFNIHPKYDTTKVMNTALNSTISRTLNTSLSTFLVLLIVFLFGGETIKGFIFALMIGVVVGTYSSLFIASPLSFDLLGKNREDKK